MHLKLNKRLEGLNQSGSDEKKNEMSYHSWVFHFFCGIWGLPRPNRYYRPQGFPPVREPCLQTWQAAYLNPGEPEPPNSPNGSRLRI